VRARRHVHEASDALELAQIDGDDRLEAHAVLLW
jgi:hypothetical protein